MSRNFQRTGIAIGFGTTVLIACLYFINPLRVPSLDPRLRVFGFTLYRIPSNSMVPTMGPDTLFFVSAWPYSRRSPRAKDVIVFRYPPDPSVYYVKRVIASEGDEVAVSRCIAVVNGQRLAEPYIAPVEHADSDLCNTERFIVPESQVYVLGDARENSADSRLWGFVPLANVVGKVVGY